MYDMILCAAGAGRVRVTGMTIVLASGSPRRRELMAKAGYDFVVRPTDADERVEGLPRERVMALARRKAEASSEEALPVLSADTLVALGDQVLGKPRDEADARRMLASLSGRTHQVYTGVCIRYRGEYFVDCERTDVTFRPLTDGEIDEYIATGEPMDKAGAYGIQGGAGAFVERLEGPFDNVMGLPMGLVKRMIREHLPEESQI